MDCTKAFDKVRHSTLFAKILGVKIHPMIVRMLLYTYQNQAAQVCWGGQLSDPFPIRNGVRQGAVLSPILFNLYTADLFDILEENGNGDGLRVEEDYHGIYGYADDLGLLSNTVMGLQRMLDKTANYAESHNIKFSTNEIISKSKTKCMVFGQGKLDASPESLMLDKKPLPWVDSIKYLGTMLTNQREVLEKDIGVKRGRFIENTNTLIQEFKWAHPAILSNINMIYNSNIYGSNLYPLHSENLRKLFNSFSVATRNIWEVPRQTHRYIVDTLAQRHLMTSVMSNQIEFYKRLERNQKKSVRNLFSIVKEDMRTITGRNLNKLWITGIEMELIGQSDNVTDIDTNAFKRNHQFSVTPSNEEYRLGILNDLISMRTGYAFFEENQFEIDNINDMIAEVCTT